MENKKEPHSSPFRGTNKDISIRKIRVSTDTNKDGESVMTQYVLLKLKSGEEIVAVLLSKGRQGVKLFRPMLIRQVPFMDHMTGALKSATVMENWIGRTTENEVTIPNTWIGIKLTPTQDLVDAYEKYKQKEDVVEPTTTEVKNTSIQAEVSETKKKELAEMEVEMTKLLKEMSDAAGISPNAIENMSNFFPTMFSDIPSKSDVNKDMVIINLMIPPKIFKNLVENGFIEDLMMSGMGYDDMGDDSDSDEDEDMEDDVDPKPKQKKSKGAIEDFIKETETESWGNSYRDWSPDPKDYM